MTAIPQLGVPDILVDDEDQRAKKKSVVQPYGPMSSGTPSSLGNSPLHSPSAFLSPTRNSAGGQHGKTLSTTSADLTLQTNFDSFGAHPLSAPRADRTSSQAQNSYDAHQSTHSAFSFELQEPNSGHSSRNNSRNNSRRNSRSNSAVSPIQMSQILDDSIWMASIRRSATLKRKPSKW